MLEIPNKILLFSLWQKKGKENSLIFSMTEEKKRERKFQVIFSFTFLPFFFNFLSNIQTIENIFFLFSFIFIYFLSNRTEHERDSVMEREWGTRKVVILRKKKNSHLFVTISFWDLIISFKIMEKIRIVRTQIFQSLAHSKSLPTTRKESSEHNILIGQNESMNRFF